MSVPLLDLRAQNELVRQEIVEGLQDLMNRSSFILGSHVAEFEKEVAAYAHTHYAVGVSSGTDAQLLALMALGVGPGDEVIIPTFTFFSTAGVVARLDQHLDELIGQDTKWHFGCVPRARIQDVLV